MSRLLEPVNNPSYEKHVVYDDLYDQKFAVMKKGNYKALIIVDDYETAEKYIGNRKDLEIGTIITPKSNKTMRKWKK